MTLQEKFRSDMKSAMMAKDSVRLNTIRGIMSAFTNELVNLKRTPQDLLTDEEALVVIKREAKRRADAIEQYTNGGRLDLAQEENTELAIIKEYLPEMMSEEDIKKFVEAKIAADGPLDKAKMGMFIGSLMKELNGKADGSVVKKVVESLVA